MNYYFVDKNRSRQGPFPQEELLAHGVEPDTLIWRKGMEKWEKAKTVPEIASLFNEINSKADTSIQRPIVLQSQQIEVAQTKCRKKWPIFLISSLCLIAVVATLFFVLNDINGKSNVGVASQKRKQTTSTGDPFFTVGGVSFVMKLVEGGTFQMGSGDYETDNDERPVHSVTVNSFYMCETEVTQALWKAVVGTSVSHQRDMVEHSKPLRGVGDSYPIYYVNWYECQDFIYRLNQLTGANFRLPTEAEWEYAAGGGNNRNGFVYSGSYSLSSVAWYTENSNVSSHPVKSKSPNPLGLYDMSGNVWEWCQDWYGCYNTGSQTDPSGPSSGSKRVVRGGSWYSQSSFCRVSKRHKLDPSYRDTCYGLRLVMDYR